MSKCLLCCFFIVTNKEIELKVSTLILDIEIASHILTAVVLVITHSKKGTYIMFICFLEKMGLF